MHNLFRCFNARLKYSVSQHLWRPVDREGALLEAFATRHRDRSANWTFLKCAMTRYGRSHRPP